MQTIIGIDPDAGDKGHGVAIYKDGVLCELRMMTLFDITKEMLISGIECLFVIEHVKHNKPRFKDKTRYKMSLDDKISQDIGKCKQAQTELERMIDGFDGRYKLVSPVKNNWGKIKAGKDLLKLRTGWTKQSNTDTRSAAHYGYLETLEQRLMRSYSRSPSTSRKAS